MIRTWDLRKARYLALLAAVAMLGGTAIGCGDDDDDDTDGTTPPAATTVASSPTSSPTSASSPTTAASPTQANGVQIRVEDNAFAPDALTVTVGTEVTWTWAGSNPHSVVGTFSGQQVESPQQTTGTFELTFASAGTFQYQCGVHGQSMSGTITVS